MISGFVISGPDSKEKAEQVFSEDLRFPDFRTRGNDTVADNGTGSPYPAPREVERIPMPNPGFGVPEGDPVPGASSYPPVEPEKQQKTVERKPVPVAPVIPNHTYPNAPEIKTPERTPMPSTGNPQFHCDNSVLDILGKIAVSEVERSCGLQISFDQHSGVELKSGDQLGVEFDIRIPTQKHSYPQHGSKHDKCSQTTEIVTGILGGILRNL